MILPSRIRKSGLPAEIIYAFLIFVMRDTYFSHLIFFWFDHSKNIRRKNINNEAPRYVIFSILQVIRLF
jgi:hypothetical protein